MRYGFIGAGQMGGAILHRAASMMGGGRFMLCERDADAARVFSQAYNIELEDEPDRLAAACDCVFICVKPQHCDEPLKSIAESVRMQPEGRTKTLVSIMAGVTTGQIRAKLGGAVGALGAVNIVRVMPNIAASVGFGLTAVAAECECPDEVTELLKLTGEVTRVPEHLMEAESVAASCSPAFAFMFIESLADAGVGSGLSRTEAQRYAALALRGASELVLRGGHPATLKDSVCSPAGSTIRGVMELEKSGFRGAVIRAFNASADRFAAL